MPLRRRWLSGRGSRALTSCRWRGRRGLQTDPQTPREGARHGAFARTAHRMWRSEWRVFLGRVFEGIVGGARQGLVGQTRLPRAHLHSCSGSHSARRAFRRGGSSPSAHSHPHPRTMLPCSPQRGRARVSGCFESAGATPPRWSVHASNEGRGTRTECQRGSSRAGLLRSRAVSRRSRTAPSCPYERRCKRCSSSTVVRTSARFRALDPGCGTGGPGLGSAPARFGRRPRLPSAPLRNRQSARGCGACQCRKRCREARVHG